MTTPAPPDGFALTPEHPALRWRPLADIAAALDLDARTLRGWADAHGLPLRRHGATWCSVVPFVNALSIALDVARDSRRFGGWHGAGDTAASRGITFRRAWADWCARVDVLPAAAAAGFALAGTPHN